jgi:transcription antitermination factor NusG
MPTNTPNIQEERKWYVAYVRMHHERKASQKLEAMGIECFIPVREEIHQWSQRKKKVSVVLTPQMIFIHATEEERMRALTLSSISRYLVLRNEHQPAVVPNSQMERFMFMVNYSSECVHSMETPLTPGQKIRVIKGPLTGLEGEFIEMEGKTKVVVRLDILGCFGTNMPAGYVEAI